MIVVIYPIVIVLLQAKRLVKSSIIAVESNEQEVDDEDFYQDTAEVTNFIIERRGEAIPPHTSGQEGCCISHCQLVRLCKSICHHREQAGMHPTRSASIRSQQKNCDLKLCQTIDMLQGDNMHVAMGFYDVPTCEHGKHMKTLQLA